MLRVTTRQEKSSIAAIVNAWIASGEAERAGMNTVQADEDITIGDLHRTSIAELDSRPFVLFDISDGCNIWYRERVKHPNCIALVKQYLPVPPAQRHDIPAITAALNGPVVTGRLHCARLADLYGTEAPRKFLDPFTEQDAAKIHLGPGFLHRECMATFTASTLRRSNMDRKIDAFFAGTVEYGKKPGEPQHIEGEIISAHRMRCIQQIEALAERHSKNVLTMPGRMMARENYIEALLNTKYVVSPYGWGEPCYRDYEAILCGCTLIKPGRPFSNHGGHFEPGPSVVYCREDFADLADLIAQDWTGPDERLARAMADDHSHAGEILTDIFKKIKHSMRGGQ